MAIFESSAPVTLQYAISGANPRQIVAHEIDDHEVLGLILRALDRRLAKRGVVLRTEPARACAFDRAGLDVSPSPTRRKCSREALNTAAFGKSRKAANGAALRARSRQ